MEGGRADRLHGNGKHFHPAPSLRLQGLLTMVASDDDSEKIQKCKWPLGAAPAKRMLFWGLLTLKIIAP